MYVDPAVKNGSGMNVLHCAILSGYEDKDIAHVADLLLMNKYVFLFL